jgi:hypothetical protein
MTSRPGDLQDRCLHSVKVARAKIIKPNRFRHTRALMSLH